GHSREGRDFRPRTLPVCDRMARARRRAALTSLEGPACAIRGRDIERLDVPQPPEVLAMILCDQVITDVDSNKKSLIGLFDQVETVSLPCVIHKLHVYLSRTDGH